MKTKNSAKPTKIKRALTILAALLFACVLLTIAVNFYVMASVQDQIITPDEAASLDADTILVLGARVWDNGQPSGILKDRIRTGIALYKTGSSGRLLMSGDHGRDNYDEVNAMKTFAIEQGIPSENIFMDHAGFSTYESLYRARDIFQVKTVVIVSQQYHLYRALYIANHLGLTAYGVSCDTRHYNPYLLFDLRETLARCKDFVYSILQPLPTYLGEQIPITGNGDLTND